jgi:ATP dependent DNA ligase-like protein
VGRQLLKTQVLSKLHGSIRYSPSLGASLPDLIRSVRYQRLEIWLQNVELPCTSLASAAVPPQDARESMPGVCIAGYTPGSKNFDALIFGYYEDDDLIYVARTRNGFTPALREKLFQRFRHLQPAECPFANLPLGECS